MRGSPLRRQGPRPGRRGARQLRARLRPDGQGDRARGGHGRPPDRSCAVDYFDLAGDPQRWEIGVKEVWEVAEAARPRDPHDELAAPGSPEVQRVRRQLHLPDGRGQALHRHGRRPRHHRRDLLLPRRCCSSSRPTRSSAKLLEGGKRVGWGAKTIPSGGYWSMPRRLSVPGMVMCGDNVSMVNIPYLKGIHYAMHAGMYAAEAIVESLKKDESVNFEEYERKVQGLDHREGPLPLAERAPVRRQGFRRLRRDRQRLAALPRRRSSRAQEESSRTARFPMEIERCRREVPEARQQVHLRQALSVFLSGNATRDDAPNHVRIQEHVPQRGRADLGLDVPGAGLRDPRGAARHRAPRPSTST